MPTGAWREGENEREGEGERDCGPRQWPGSWSAPAARLQQFAFYLCVSAEWLRTCSLLRGGGGAAHSQSDAAVLVEAVEGVPLGAGDHLSGGVNGTSASVKCCNNVGTRVRQPLR